MRTTYNLVASPLMHLMNFLQFFGTAKRTKDLCDGQDGVSQSSTGVSVVVAAVSVVVVAVSVVVIGVSVTSTSSSHLAQIAYLGSLQILSLISKLRPFGQALKEFVLKTIMNTMVSLCLTLRLVCY